MKKLFAVLLILACVVSCLPAWATEAANAPEVFTCGDYEYIILEDGTAEIANYIGSGDTLEIPSELDGKAVTGIGDSAFYNRRDLYSVVIPEGVVSIGNSAFYNCRNLAELTIPENLTSIGDLAFYYCNMLSEITIPDSVTDVGTNPFAGCTYLWNINISPNHPVLEMTDAVLFSKPDDRLIGAFSINFTTSTYNVPQGTAIIGGYAFADCAYTDSIVLPDSVTAIGDFAFYGCNGLKTVVIPDSVTEIGSNPFYLCSNLSLIISADHPTLALADGVPFFKPDDRLVSYPANSDNDSYAIPEGTRAIGNAAFLSVISLTSVSVPDGVTSIGDSAFFHCSNMTSINIPDSVTSIGADAFAYCDKLVLTVGEGSYAEEYCVENSIPYTCE